MTVEPGFGGQKFMTDMMPKVREVREMITANNYDCILSVDGGIGLETIKTAASFGANCFAAGTSFFKSDDAKATCELLRKTASEYYK